MLRPRTFLVSTGLLVLVGSGGALAVRSQVPEAGVASPAAVHQAVRSAGALPTREAAPARRATSLVDPEAPTAVRLPNGRSVPILPVSTRADRTLDVPSDITLAGWWRGGSRLGDPFGSILVAAHIDSSTQGLGPFAALLSVRPEQRVRLTSGHLRQDFVVRSRRLVPQGSLAQERWLFAPTGKPRLTLVTCAPPYDKARGGYQNLAVITATPVTAPMARVR